MDKFAVVTEDQTENGEKTASLKACPKCQQPVDQQGNTPRCRRCGTEPFEPSTKDRRNNG